VFFFVFAAGTGVAHHFFYSFLDGRLAENQAVSISLVLTTSAKMKGLV
jgi:hypothetical protein